MASGILVHGRVVVEDPKTASRLFNSGYFGAFQGGKLELSLEEALYLKENKNLKIIDSSNKNVTFQAFVKQAEKINKRFWVRYCGYRDMRTNGYILKTAFKYGGDFRVYQKGSAPGKEHADWILYLSSEREAMTFTSFSAINRVAHSVRKRVLFGVVDDEGSVTYYETMWTRM